MKMIMYPCFEGWDSQKYWEQHHGLDFGWLKDYSEDGKTPVVACDSGVVEFEGFYEGCVFPTSAVVKDDTLFVYYGCADKYIGLATCNFTEFVEYLYKECRI